MNGSTPITEAELHAHIDGQLPAARAREVEAYLASRPDEAQRVESYRAQKRELHALFDPVLDEALPQRVLQAAQPRAVRSTPWYAQRLVAGIAIALVSGALGWGLRGGLPADGGLLAQRGSATTNTTTTIASSSAATGGFVQRAAVAHAVYSPDVKRAVEVDAAHEDQLVTWLSKRMGAPMKPPHLQAVGYALEGGRLLPGGQGPVAQFMYRDAQGRKLTLYVSNEVGAVGEIKGAKGGELAAGTNTGTAFRFAQQGAVNVFYWVEGPFGYALSADADRAVLAGISAEVYRQLGVGQ